jgi:hypothetical protein
MDSSGSECGPVMGSLMTVINLRPEISLRNFSENGYLVELRRRWKQIARTKVGQS